MEQTAGSNAAAVAGIAEATAPTVEELLEKIRGLETEKEARRLADEERQLRDQHVNTANESRSATKERFAIVIDEARDPNEVDPVPVSPNGRMYLIRRGQIVHVPAEVIDVLNHAVEDKSIPRVDAQGNPNGYTTRKARRFPFQNYGKSFDAEGKPTGLKLPEVEAQPE